MLNEMNQDYNIRSLGLRRVWKRNNVSYYPYSLSVQAQGGEGLWSLKDHVIACLNTSF